MKINWISLFVMILLIGTVSAETISDDTHTVVIVEPDDTAPGPISNLHLVDKGTTWIEWAWNNPSDADFNGTIIYLGVDDWMTNLSKEENSYRAEGLTPDTEYMIIVFASDDAFNVAEGIANTQKTDVSNGINPDPVTNLHLVDKGTTWIEWAWNNPSDADFAGTSIYINGDWVANLSDSKNSYKIEGLEEGSNYTITVYSFDEDGNFGDGVSDTQTTSVDDEAPAPITNLKVDDKGEEWIRWEWNNPEDEDFAGTMIYIDDEWVANLSADKESYKAKDLDDYTRYRITVYTFDDNGNIGEGVSDTERTKSDGGGDYDDDNDYDSYDDYVYLSESASKNTGSSVVNISTINLGGEVTEEEPKISFYFIINCLLLAILLVMVLLIFLLVARR